MQLDHEFQSLIPPLSESEFSTLKHSLLTDGCREPLITWNDILLDGHNRFTICEDLGIKYRTKAIDLPNRDAAKVWMIHNQFGRRNLTPFQRAELALQLEPLIAEQAKENQRQSCGRGKKGCQNSDNLFDTKKELAKVAHVSHDTMAKVKFIQKHADEHTKQKLRTDETSIHAVYEDLKRPLVTFATGCEEWWTPPDMLEAARSVLGTIDLDPASNPDANKAVKANQFYTVRDDGLSKEWKGTIWLNPPYSVNLIDKFISKLISHYEAGDVSQAIVLTNNCTETKWFQSLARHSVFVLTNRRIKFISPDATKVSQPTCGQTIFYLGGMQSTFCKHFRQFGMICQEVA